MKRGLLTLALLAACFPFANARSGEPGDQAGTPPVREDPFAELLKTHPSTVVKTGPSCSLIRVELPPGVKAEDIPGVEAR